MNLKTQPMDVAIIGAGIVGVCSGLKLAEHGLHVTIFDPNPICSQTSFGNAGVISPWTCVPQSMPGLWKKVPSWLINPDGPISIRLGYFPILTPWILRFISASTRPRLDNISDAMFALSNGSVKAYRKLLEGTGSEDLVRDSNYVHVYRNSNLASFENLGWKLRQERKVPVELINKQKLRELEPEISDEYNAAILIKEQGRAMDPAGIGIAIAKKALALGAKNIKAKVHKIYPDNGAGCTLITDSGEYQAKKIVLAAGIWSHQLLVEFGLKIPIEAERGYHLILQNPGIEINNSVMDAEEKFVASTMFGGIRVAGTAEFSGLHTAPNFSRARRLAKQAKRLFPNINCDAQKEWMGSRPSFPDSLPCLGIIPNLHGVIVAFGHSHYGLGMAPRTAEIVTACVLNKKLNVNLEAYNIGRF